MPGQLMGLLAPLDVDYQLALIEGTLQDANVAGTIIEEGLEDEELSETVDFSFEKN
jgi:hypothetical protein